MRPDLAKEIDLSIIDCAAKEEGAKALIVNLTEAKGTFTNMKEHLTTMFFPTLKKNGVDCCAVVINDDVFIKFATKSIQKELTDFDFTSFDNLNQAKDWISDRI